MADLTPEQVARNAALDLAREPLLRRVKDLSEADRWRLAHETVAGLLGWQPDEPWCGLDQVEVAASGPHDPQPLVVMRWHQGNTQHLAVLNTDDLVEMADYDHALHVPDRPQPRDWLGLLMLTVYEPHGSAPGGASLWVHVNGVP